MMETLDSILTAGYYLSMGFGFLIWFIFLIAAALLVYGVLCYGYFKGLYLVMSKTFLKRMGEPALVMLTGILTLPWAVAVMGGMAMAFVGVPQ